MERDLNKFLNGVIQEIRDGEIKRLFAKNLPISNLQSPDLDFIHLWDIDQGLSEEEYAWRSALFCISRLIGNSEKDPKCVVYIHALCFSNEE